MNIGVIRESGALDRRVALTPAVARRLTEHGHTVWVERGAGEGAMFRDQEYIGAGAHIAYSCAEVLQRSELAVQISAPSLTELNACPPGIVLLAFYHLAVAERAVLRILAERPITAVGCEIIQTGDGHLPVLAAVSEIAGQMTVPLAAHLLRSSSGGRGILLGGSLGVPPAHVVILGAGVVGTWAARTAIAAGARVTVFDIEPEKLRRLLLIAPGVETCLSDPDSVAAAAVSADVLIGAVLVAGSRTPHVVSRKMVEKMKPGAVIIDVSIDQGGCVETSRPTTIAEPTFISHGVLHFCVPNFTADLGRSTSVAVAQALLPYLLEIGEKGIDSALLPGSDLARGLYTHRGVWLASGFADAGNA
ncbi:MAG: alanine dehydrogenase [Acidobacteria bacterium]|nr:alanine dehydrogenase [Acidobacteriota bacterium]